MTIETIVLLITTLGGFGGTGVLLYKAKADKKRLTTETGKISADAAAVISDSAVALLKPMQDAIADLEKRLRSTTARADRLDRQLCNTTADLREATKQLNQALDRIDELEASQRGASA